MRSPVARAVLVIGTLAAVGGCRGGAPAGSQGEGPSGGSSSAGVTRPTSSATGEAALSGEVTYRIGADVRTVRLADIGTPAAPSGRLEISDSDGELSLDVGCIGVADATTWMLGGEVTESTNPAHQAGTRAAVITRPGTPPQAMVWFEDPPPADDCDAFLEGIPMAAVNDPNGLTDVASGDLIFPAATP